MAEPRDLPANQRPPMDVGGRPGLGFELPRECEVVARQPPGATDPQYSEAHEVRREAAWDLYRLGGSGPVAFLWVQTQTGEIGQWILEIGWAHTETQEGATVIRLL